MRHLRALTLVVLTALLLGACGAGSRPTTGPTPSAPAVNGVEGRTFLSTTVDGRVLVVGSRIRLSFMNGQVGASAGCNSMGGPYKVDGGRLVTTQLITTDMGCAPALMTQDQWVADLLNGAALTLDGNTLTLAKDGVRLTLLDRKVADPDRPLLGNRWVVDGVLSGDTATSVPSGVTASITFSDGRVDVETGCNSGTATATIADGSITFSDLSLTKKGCPPDIAALEQAVVNVLKGTASYTIEADALALRSGAFGLTLRAPSR